MCHYIFLFTDTPTTEIYTLSLHDALPIYEFRLEFDMLKRLILASALVAGSAFAQDNTDISGANFQSGKADGQLAAQDRKSTRLNSSHVEISYAVFCLKKKNEPRLRQRPSR